MDYTSTINGDVAAYLQTSLRAPRLLELFALLIALLLIGVVKSQGVLWDRPDPYGYIYFERPQSSGGESGKEDQNLQRRNVAQEMERLEADIVIFWGSQSGNAEHFAQRLYRVTNRQGVKALLADLSDFDAASIAQIRRSKIVIFLVATYGEGGPSDNAIEFWHWLHDAHSPRNLVGLKFMTFGLGSSNYKFYNYVVDKVEKSFVDAGAALLFPTGKADDATGSTEEDYMEWASSVQSVVASHFGLTVTDRPYAPLLTIEFDAAPTSARKSMAVRNPSTGLQRSDSLVKHLPMISSMNLFQRPNDRTCVDIQIDLIEHAELRYKTGDHLMIWPENPDQEVALLAKMAGAFHLLDKQMFIRPVSNEIEGDTRADTSTSLRDYLRHQLDICGPVSRETVLKLAEFAPTQRSSACLKDLGNDRQAFTELKARRHLNFGRLLQFASDDVPWTNLPLSFVVESISPLQPRLYSISSSSVVSPRRLGITVLVHSKQLTTSTAPESADIIPGLASSYLARCKVPAAHNGLETDATSQNGITQPTLMDEDLRNAAFVHASIRRTSFKLPISSSVPMIMIANGTGIAPFKAFLAERTKLHEMGRRVGPMMLFYGCRNVQTDFLYGEEIVDYQKRLLQSDGEAEKRSVKLDVWCASSRALSSVEQPSVTVTSGYVQDVVSSEVANVLQWMMEHGANTYICGGALMAIAVRKVLVRAYNTRDASGSGGNAWVDSLKKRGKWKEDVWS